MEMSDTITPTISYILRVDHLDQTLDKQCVHTLDGAAVHRSVKDGPVSSGKSK